jgi:hypothetical protein
MPPTSLLSLPTETILHISYSLVYVSDAPDQPTDAQTLNHPHLRYVSPAMPTKCSSIAPRAKSPWEDIQGVISSSKYLRAIFLRAWFESTSFHGSSDWHWLARHDSICTLIRFVLISRPHHIAQSGYLPLGRSTSPPYPHFSISFTSSLPCYVSMFSSSPI